MTDTTRAAKPPPQGLARTSASDRPLRDRSYTCVLSGHGNGPASTADIVKVGVHS